MCYKNLTQLLRITKHKYETFTGFHKFYLASFEVMTLIRSKFELMVSIWKLFEVMQIIVKAQPQPQPQHNKKAG